MKQDNSPTAERASRLALWALTGLAVLHVTLILSARLFPFVDIPNHLAMATIVRHSGDAGNLFADTFRLDLFPKPNVFYLLFCSIPIFPSVEAATKIFFCAYVVLLPFSVLLLIRRLGGNPWYALLAFLLPYNFSLIWGFVGFTIAIPFVLLAIWLTIDHLESASVTRSCALALLFVLLFSMHALALLLAGGVFVLSCIWRYRCDARSIMRKGIVLLPALLLVVAWQAVEIRDSERGGDLLFLPYYYKTQYLGSWASRIHFLTQDHRELIGSHGPSWLGALFTLAILVPGVIAALRTSAWGKSSACAPVTLLAVVALAGYFVFPERLSGYHLLYQRLAVPCLAALVVLASLHAPQRQTALAVGLCAAALVYWSLCADLYRDFHRESRDFTESVFPEEGTVAGLVTEPFFRHHASYLHALDYYIVWRHGIATTRFIDARSFPVLRRADETRLPRYHEWVMAWLDSEDFRDDFFDQMDYVLVKGAVPDRARGLLSSFEIDRERGDWRLFRNHALAGPTEQ